MMESAVNEGTTQRVDGHDLLRTKAGAESGGSVLPRAAGPPRERFALHDHLCLVYDSREEQFAVAVPFILDGLAKEQRCIYIADDNSADVVLGALREAGIDTDEASRRGALQILARRDSCLRHGSFDPDAMVEFLGEATGGARAEGCSALRFAEEMTWALGGAPGSERLIEYEARLNDFLPEVDALALCQYNRGRFPPETMLDVIRTHPAVIIGDTRCDNPFYVPPDDLLQPRDKAREVERVLDAIALAGRSRVELQEASRAWSATFDAINDMVCLLDRDGTVLRCNRSMAGMFGLTQAQVAGRKCFELMHGGDTFFEACPYREMLRTGVRESLELPLGARWYEVTADPLRGGLDEIVGAVHIVRDVTDRRRAEEALRTSESRARFWAAVVEHAADAVAIGTPDGRIVGCNQAWCDLTGYSEAELSALDWRTTLTPADWRGPVTNALAELERTGAPARYEKEIVRKDGVRVPVELVVRLQHDPDDQSVRYTAFARDATERKQAEGRIREMNNELEWLVAERTRELTHANRRLQEFVYSVSHDLRAPLRAIDGFSLAVLEAGGPALDDASREDLRRVRAAAQRLGQVLDGMVSLSAAGRHEPRLERVDLSDLAAQIVSELHAEHPDREVEATIEPGLTAETDALLAEVVLANLLGNAWKFTSGRRPAHIAVGTTMREGRRAFFVSDDGTGFDPAYARKLFTPFETLHAAGEFPGTGVGLATVARILERLGGTCWAEASPGEGATFYFVLAADDPAR
jgi:PAS domain S-box-containing protein